jgi:hypothetical protein
MGHQNVVVTDTATVDCQPPAIMNVGVINLQPRSAQVIFDADEPVRGTVFYGRSCGNLNQQASNPALQQSQVITLTGLQDNTTYYFAVRATDAAGNFTDDNNNGACYSFTTPEVPDYYTELFDAGDNDLDNKSLVFTPDGGPDFYYGCVEQPITELPTDPAGGTVLSLTDDSYATVNLSGGTRVYLYGVAYSTMYVGSNGYITFNSGDTTYSESLANHFNRPRISALFDDLNPGAGGQVSWKQLADRVAVTWLNVPEFGTSNQNTFQIELFYDGRIVISYLAIAATDGLAGLSAGNGVPDPFFESDLANMGSCGPRPPRAADSNVVVPVDTPVDIELLASDDGLPDPPGRLTYRIKSLPVHGDLYDPQAGPIVVVPYDLVNYGNHVTYVPDGGYYGPDSFTFAADDGGVPPEGGESNTATVLLSVQYGPPQIVPQTLPDGCVGRNYSYQIQVSGGQPPLAWSLVGTGAYTETDLGSSQFAVVGVAQNWRADDSSWSYTLPFVFPYYGQNFSSLWVCSNGFLDFTSSSAPYSNSTQALIAAKRIAPLWDDLMTNQNTGDDIYIDASVPGQVTFRWKGVTYASPRTEINVAVTLYADGRIRFHYGPVNGNLTPTIGISNGDNVNYTLSMYNNASALPNAHSVEYAQLPSLPAGVTLSGTGLLSGTPTQSGTFYPRVKVTDSLNRTDEEVLTLVILPTCPYELGDLNCDGQVNAFDIDPFVLAITNPSAYGQQYPNCDIMLADCNGDGQVNAFDIDPFVEILTGK